MASIATYFAFPGNTAEVFEHWHEVFGGELEIIRYSDMQLEGMPFEPDPDAVAHVILSLPAGELAGGDVMDDKDYPIRDTAYSMLYTSDTAAEARDLAQKLIDAGGTIGMPLEEPPWGGFYGQVFDRYGVMWAFSCDEA